MHDYLAETRMLDYSNENIKRLIRERKWNDMAEFERLKAIYTFVRDEILFGYNVDDSVPASRVAKFAPLLSSLNNSDDTTRLLDSLRPFLSHERQEKLDKAEKMLCQRPFLCW